MPDTALPDTTVITESFWTLNVRQQVVTTCTSATRPTGVEGRTIFETDTDLEYTYNGTGWEQVGGVGGWTLYTPTWAQSASITTTVSYSKWVRGPRRTITWSFQLAATSSGTAANAVSLTLPVAAASASAVHGVARIFDSSASANYVCEALGVSTTTLNFYHDTSTASVFGIAPAITIASGDNLVGSVTYEAAT